MTRDVQNRRASILVVEDDENILNLLSAYLESAGHRVATLRDGKAGLAAALNEPFDLCVLDVMLPGLGGTEMALRLRAARREMPILFLTALGAETDILKGFDAGADDYIDKPFSPRVLLVRIDAILRRIDGPGEVSGKTLRVGPFEIDEDHPTCRVNQRRVTLTPHEHRILRKLLTRPDRVFDRSTLVATLYGNEVAVGPKAIDVHIHNLRAKLGPEAGELIKTVRGFGYVFSLMHDRIESDV